MPGTNAAGEMRSPAEFELGFSIRPRSPGRAAYGLGMSSPEVPAPPPGAGSASAPPRRADHVGRHLGRPEPRSPRGATRRDPIRSGYQSSSSMTQGMRLTVRFDDRLHLTGDGPR